MRLKLVKLLENLLLEYNKQQESDFNTKFGDGSFDKFVKMKDRLVKNGYSADIQIYLKDNFTVDDWKELNKKLYDNLDIDGQEIPEPKNTKKLLLDNGGEKLYFVTDVGDMIELSNGTGRGDIGGRKTGWCIGGRYDVPFGKVKASQAKKYFKDYIKDYNLDNSGYYVVLKDNQPLYCILVRDNQIVDITDSDDNDHYFDYFTSQGLDYLSTFKQEVPNTYDYFVVEGIIEDVYDVTFTYAGSDGDVIPKNAVNIEIEDGITEIEDDAFYEFKSLENIYIPDSVISIGDWAFEYCSNLTSVTIPDSVTRIGDGAFSYCDSLTNVVIPDSVTSIGDSAFSGCSGLTSVTIGNGVTSIGYRAFSNCTNLVSITIGNSVTSIGRSAFRDCRNLRVATIGNSVTTIGRNAFYNCEYLSSINIPNSVQQIDCSAFENCLSLKKVVIESYTTKIGENVFDECSQALTIVCHEKSFAENYAKKHNIRVEYIK